MADEQDRPVDLPDHLSRAFGVVGEGRQRVLHSVERVVAPSVQLDDDLRPMGGATPEAVDKNDVQLVAHTLLLAVPMRWAVSTASMNDSRATRIPDNGLSAYRTGGRPYAIRVGRD